MAGTKEGAKKAREKNLARNPNFYSDIGKIGAEKYQLRKDAGIAKPRGFAANPELAREAGKKGGAKSRRN